MKAEANGKGEKAVTRCLETSKGKKAKPEEKGEVRREGGEGLGGEPEKEKKEKKRYARRNCPSVCPSVTRFFCKCRKGQVERRG